MWDYSNLIQCYQMTDVPNKLALSDTNVQETAKLHSTSGGKLFLNIDFQRSKG